jgi:AcrR family transcriptional regulator
MTESQQEIDQIKAAILAAAQERFRGFGYGKTTMAEIAEDVSMSAANLYRYFHNKQDIAAECAGQCMADLGVMLDKVVHLPNLNGEQRLHLYVQTAMRYNFEMMHDVPRLNELIENITSNYPQLIHDKNAKSERQLVSILQQAIDAGEFEIEELKVAASAISKATAMFTTPFFMQLYTMEEFEKMAVNVVSLIINGLRKTN